VRATSQPKVALSDRSKNRESDRQQWRAISQFLDFLFFFALQRCRVGREEPGNFEELPQA